MVVPPFVPPQIEIPGNVALAGYNSRVKFVKRVVFLYLASAIVVLVAGFSPIRMNSATSLGILVGSLLALSIARYAAKGKRQEQLISLLLSPALLISLSHTLRFAWDAGFPIWMLILAPVAMSVYAAACGRDLSFTAMFTLGFIGVATAVIGISIWQQIPAALACEGLLAAGALLFYLVYDLAALQTRRKRGEELGAVLDLYRDVLNVFSYPIRVLRHWREHRIWSAR